ncbi:MAG: hypothetical protein Q7R87_03530 [Nanoarchaeota archaeon]|nr:hypothetical protein [Nanoarchaeota archaeon]
MEFKKQLVSLVAFVAMFALMVSSVSAFAQITSVEVSGVEGLSAGSNISVFAGTTVPVRIIFTATADANDVRVKVWLSGSSDYTAASDRFVVDAGSTYSKLIAVQVPHDVDPQEDMRLEVSIENRANGQVDRREISLSAQRESYTVQILDVAADSKVSAGDNLALDIVLKNRGRELAEDTFVTVSIPALGIERRAYFGDMSPVDQTDPLPEKEDASTRRLFLNIPSNVPAGIYTIQVDAFTADSKTTVTKKVAVVGASDSSRIVSASTTKTVAVGEDAVYSVTVVNTGNKVQVYDLSFDAPADLSVNADEAIVVVPAGTSKTVKVMSSADKAGKYAFVVSVNSDGELVTKQNFVTNVEGKKNSTANATVVLTVVLAIIFVVLLVVLIVLLTKKPQKAEEFGESYY